MTDQYPANKIANKMLRAHHLRAAKLSHSSAFTFGKAGVAALVINFINLSQLKPNLATLAQITTLMTNIPYFTY